MTMSLPAWLATAAWCGACSLVCAGLLAFHTASLPIPARTDDGLRAALRDHAVDGERGHWRMVHVLYQRCTCSARIIDHLVSSARPAGIVERVVLVDAAADTVARLTHAGFVVEQESPASLHAHWHIEAAPLLLVVDDHGDVRYAGGYTEQKQGPTIVDLAMFKASKADAHALLSGLPLLGCAVSRDLQDTVDPLGLKRLLAWRPFSSPS